MKRIFVCSPFAAPDAAGVRANVERAKSICRDIAKRGDSPLAPHLHYPSFLRDDVAEERALGFLCAGAWLSVANELWVYGIPTPGMRAEIAAAKRLGMPVRYFR